jgi:hypothetical protein
MLRDDEHLNLGLTLLEDWREDVANISALGPKWDEYEAVVQHENQLFQISKASPQTRGIRREDKVRDGIFREVRRFLKYYSRSDNPARKSAAVALLFVMKDYKEAAHRNLFGETAYIRNFLQDLGKTEHQGQITVLVGLAEMLADLSVANERVDNLYTDRLHTVEQLDALGKRVIVRKEADGLLIGILQAINSIDHYNSMTAKDAALSERLERMARRFHGLLDKLSRVVSQRSGRHRKASDENQASDENPASSTTPSA